MRVLAATTNAHEEVAVMLGLINVTINSVCQVNECKRVTADFHLHAY